MTAPHTNASYDVGYGKPPRRTQFQKGRSGNPGGRPRRRPVEYVREMALQEAYRTVIVERDGEAVPMPAIRAVVRSQFEIAAAGNARAQCAVLAMVRELESDKAFDARHPQWRKTPVYDDDADYDDADYDGADNDDDGEPAPQADETGAGEMGTDEIGTEAETQQEKRAQSAAPPSSEDSAPLLENAAAPPARSPGVKSPAAKSSAAKSRPVKSPPRAAGGRVRKGAVPRDTASTGDTPSKRRVRRERGRSARTAAARKTTPDQAAPPGLQAGVAPARRPAAA
jgi:hypothetical protein